MKLLLPVTALFLFGIMYFQTSHAAQGDRNPKPWSSATQTREHPADTSANAVLRKVSNQLNDLERISFNYQLVVDYPGSGYHFETKSDSYFEFLPFEKRIGMRFQHKDEDQIIYNTSELFTLTGKNKTIKMERQPENWLNSVTVFYNSLPALRKALPVIIADQSIQKTAGDTTINNKVFYLLKFQLYKKTISHLGELDIIQMDITRSYTMIVDKSNFLPVQFTESFPHNNAISTVNTRFTHINLQPDLPSEDSWYSTTYLDEYTPEIASDVLPQIAVDQIASDWLLSKYGSADSISLGQYKGNIVLLDFWFCFCSPCIASVPGLNKLEHKYKGKKFKLLSLNTHDTPDQIRLFIKNHSPEADILQQGIGVSKQYGIKGYPTIVVVGKDGKVIYSGEYDYGKLDAVIGKAL